MCTIVELTTLINNGQTTITIRGLWIVLCTNIRLNFIVTAHLIGTQGN